MAYPFTYVPIGNQLPQNQRPVFITPSYYSGSDANIYIKRDNTYVLMAEGKALAYEMNEKTMPIYGYASYTPSRWARGSRLVSGMFTVNMLGVNYLYELIGNVINDDSIVPTSKIQTEEEKEINQYVQQYWFPEKEPDSSISSSKRINLGNNPYFRKTPFNIIMAYKLNDVSTLNKDIVKRQQSIDNVFITSMTLQMDVSGRPIEQTYSFLAADINRVHWGT